MLTHTQYSAATQFALLLIGPPLAGKTNVAMNFPDPYFLDADDKLANAAARHPGKRFWYDCPLRRDGKTSIPLPEQWGYVSECINAAIKVPEIRTIVLDSATALSDMLIAHILKFGTKLTIAGQPSMEMQHWGPFAAIWKKLIMGIRASGKMLVLISHERVIEDQLNGSKSIGPLIGGSLKDNLGSMFTDVWHAEHRTKPNREKPGQMTTEYFVRTQPFANMTLGTSLKDLPAEFVVTPEEVLKRVPNLTPPTQPPTVA